MSDVASSEPAVDSSSSPASIVFSCRLPLFVMFVSAAVWLVLGSLFGLISTIKFHDPNFLGNISWLTYGRTHPAYLNSMLYGFCLQAGLGVMLWIAMQLGRAPLPQRWQVTIGAMLWNLGVTVGILGLLAGDATGFPLFDLPGYAAVIMLIAFLGIGVWTVVTIHRRCERGLLAPQWFILAALFWFVWIYSTAALLLLRFPVRGMAQAVITWWYANNLLVVWFGLAGLAAAFYFSARLTNSVRSNRNLALLTFWMLILFGSWGGIPNTAPVPAWMPALSTVSTVFMIIPIITVAMDICGTLQGRWSLVNTNTPALVFIVAGLAGFILAQAMNIISAFPLAGVYTRFTWFAAAKLHANFYAFFSLIMFGAIYIIVPQLAGFELPLKWVKTHLWLAIAGILFLIVPLAIGGLIQGQKLANARIAFVDISKGTLTFLRVSTLGDLLIAAGHVVFFLNVAGLVNRFCRTRAVAAYEAATADLFKTAEVKP